MHGAKLILFILFFNKKPMKYLELPEKNLWGGVKSNPPIVKQF